MGSRSGIILGLLVALTMAPPIVMAQTALRATTPLSEIDPADFLVLEPETSGLQQLAAEVATVLELRNGTVLIEVKAVPSSPKEGAEPAPGHIRMVMDDLCLTLVMGMTHGESLELPLPLGRGATMPDPRAVALAIETLRDPWLNDPEQQRARLRKAAAERDWLLDDEAPFEEGTSDHPLIEELLMFGEEIAGAPPDDGIESMQGALDFLEPGQELGIESVHEKTADVDVTAETSPSKQVRERRAAAKGMGDYRLALAAEEGDGRADVRPLDEGLPSEHQLGRTVRVLEPVKPFIFARAYSGASAYSRMPQVGVATGAGLCAVGHCLVLATELPVTIADVQDVRYRYVTFLSSFYSRPFTWGDFTPGASLGFLTRLGYFSQDMGLSEAATLETDLAARASLEVAWEAYSFVDLMVEGGVDVALDRIAKHSDGLEKPRGQLLSPWLQFAVRVRPAAN